MYKARNYINKKALLGLYHSYIYPYLIYCIESWGNASNCHIDPLSMLQKRILRILTFSNYDVPSELLFRYTNILPLCKHHYIDLTHNSPKAWKSIRNLSNDPTTLTPPCLVNYDQVAHQLLTNGRSAMYYLHMQTGEVTLVHPFSEEEYRI